MNKLILTIPVAAALLASTGVPAMAAVSCGIIQKDLERGRKPEDIAERMGVTVAQVNDCKGKDERATTDAATAPKVDTAPKGVMPPATGSGANPSTHQ